jgi:uncharacterized membrane protein
MKPLVVLIIAFALSLLSIYLISGLWNYELAGRIAMSAMLLFTAIGHFAFTKGMAMMVPDVVPYKREIIYITGVFEIIAAIGLLIPSVQVWSAVTLIVFFILMLPGNIKASLQHMDYQKGNLDGPGPAYLWFRIPLQVLFIAWTYACAIRF